MLRRYYSAVRLLVCSATASSPRLPVAARGVGTTAGQTRSPRFRRAPFERDVACDPGRASAPRIAAPHMLPSAVAKVSAPALSVFRGSIPHPIQLLCTLRRGRHLPRRNTRYQADATPYLGRTFTGWIAPASPGAPLRIPVTLRVFQLFPGRDQGGAALIVPA
jgi:hypothetical protein